ncbi:sigma-70 family RNA polymerase sigma factor [Pseudoflavonifractor sp. 60]|nr:sigma-70 family RNA polymerase sigma factor [Pseudoflavonifractor sp. 60]
MRWTIHRIEDICRYDAPGHTAYLNVFRRPCLGFSRRNKREPVKKPTEPPPARSVTSVKYPNAYQAAEYPRFCGVGRSFSTCGYYPGCRSPPIKISRLPSVTINFDWKGNLIMVNDMKLRVTYLLETYQERQRKIALPHYELDHPAHASETEMISAMALGHGDGSGGGHMDGRISDKTLYIALNYQSKANKLNADIKEEIVVQLVELEQEQRRLEYYVSLLEKRQAEVIRLIHFEGHTQNEVATELAVVPRTVRRIRNEALDKLVDMFSFAKDFAE